MASTGKIYLKKKLINLLQFIRHYHQKVLHELSFRKKTALTNCREELVVIN